MTHEARASLIKKLIMLVLMALVVTAVWFYPKPVEKAPPKTEVADDALSIVSYHLPGDPHCEKLAEVLNRVQKKYGKLVAVSRVDVKARPELAKAQGIKKVPHVNILAGSQKVFEFEGVWSQEQVEGKIEEILRGLKRVGKDWRPEVQGMKPATK